MHKPLSAIAAWAVAAAVALPILASAQANRTKVGTLSCDVSGGIGLIITSKKDLTCMFTPSQPGPREVYVGSITKFGLDLGATAGGEMVWAVYAPTTRKFGALAGDYGGATAEATVGPASAQMFWSAVQTALSPCSQCRSKARRVLTSRLALPSFDCARRVNA